MFYIDSLIIVWSFEYPISVHLPQTVEYDLIMPASCKKFYAAWMTGCSGNNSGNTVAWLITRCILL